MNFATKTSRTQILVWLIWLIAWLAFVQPAYQVDVRNGDAPLLGIVTHNNRRHDG